MSTVRTILEAAGRKIGVRDFEPDELEDAFDTLNIFLNSLSAEGITNPEPIKETFTLTAGTDEYTVGSGGDFDTDWPIRIKTAYITDNDYDYPLRLFSAENYAYTGDKDISLRPRAIYYSRNYPLGTFLFWPNPSENYTFNLWSYKALGGYTSYTESLTLPPEYENMIIYNLAVELAPEFEQEPSQLVFQKAQALIKAIKRMNAQPVPVINTNVICRKPCRTDSAELFSGYGGAGVAADSDVFPYTFPFTLS